MLPGCVPTAKASAAHSMAVPKPTVAGIIIDKDACVLTSFAAGIGRLWAACSDVRQERPRQGELQLCLAPRRPTEL